jgi:hypothetical protein
MTPWGAIRDLSDDHPDHQIHEDEQHRAPNRSKPTRARHFSLISTRFLTSMHHQRYDAGNDRADEQAPAGQQHGGHQERRRPPIPAPPVDPGGRGHHHDANQHDHCLSAQLHSYPPREKRGRPTPLLSAAASPKQQTESHSRSLPDADSLESVRHREHYSSSSKTQIRAPTPPLSCRSSSRSKKSPGHDRFTSF